VEEQSCSTRKEIVRFWVGARKKS